MIKEFSGLQEEHKGIEKPHLSFLKILSSWFGSFILFKEIVLWFEKDNLCWMLPSLDHIEYYKKKLN